jgi:hypothetical protein
MKNVAAFPLAMLLSTAAQAEEYTLSVVAGIFSRCDHLGWNYCMGRRPDRDARQSGQQYCEQLRSAGQTGICSGRWRSQAQPGQRRDNDSLHQRVPLRRQICRHAQGILKDGNYPGSALITVTNFARPGIEIEIQAVGVIGDSCSNDNPCSAEAKAKKGQNR